PQVMIRLPADTKARLDALSGVTGTPIWRLIDRAVDLYLSQLPESERRLIDDVRDRRASQRRRHA
ncbi:MAG TPA: hypothetical protein VI258_10845, partial [Rhodanobacteraceae bacterium]